MKPNQKRQARSSLLVVVIFALNPALLFGGETAQQSSMKGFMERRGYQCIALKRTELNRFWVQGKLNGSKAVCMIDTGATYTALDSPKATKLKRVQKTKTSGRGLFGAAPSEIESVNIDSLQLEGVTISNVCARVRNLHAHHVVRTGSRIAQAGPDISEDLLIGMDLLEAMNAIMDCGGPAALYIRAQEPGEQLGRTMHQSFCQSGFAWIALTNLWGCFLVECRINEHPAQLLLDTGAPDTDLDLSQLKAFQLTVHGNLGTSSDVNAHKSELDYSIVDSFAIGAYERRNFPVGVVDLRLPNSSFAGTNQLPMAGALGVDLLGRAGALIDCAGQKLYLKLAAN